MQQYGNIVKADTKKKSFFHSVIHNVIFSNHYSSIQSPKSFWYADLVLKKHFLLLLYE